MAMANALPASLDDLSTLPEYITVRGCTHGLEWYELDAQGHGDRSLVVYIYPRDPAVTRALFSVDVVAHASERYSSIVRRAREIHAEAA